MYEYDIMVSMRFLSEEKGGRRKLPPIKNKEYTYRPLFKIENEKIGYCCGVVIGEYINNYSFDTDLMDIKIIFLQFSEVKNKLSVGKHFSLYEGNEMIGTGCILKIRD
ncbi:MAG: hypothetical protein PUC37_07270 [Spirochaetales bacterium]|nr:hypothetical protein [Spirochaetales bacterium]